MARSQTKSQKTQVKSSSQKTRSATRSNKKSERTGKADTLEQEFDSWGDAANLAEHSFVGTGAHRLQVPIVIRPGDV
jgi:DNA transposition AAA+ family ATPase